MIAVSIVVPTLNEAPNLARCVRSVWAQQELVGEVLIVDCGSTDGTVEVAEALREEYAAIRLLRSEERSYAAAVGAGVRHARSEYVQLVDGDSLLAGNWLTLGLEHLEEHGCDAVRGRILLENDSLYGAMRKSGKKDLKLSFGGPALFRAEAIKSCNYDPEIRRSSDVDVYVRMSVEGYEQCSVEEPMLVKDDRDNSGVNVGKVLAQGFYSGLMLAKNSHSTGYVDHFLRLRRSYFLYAAFLTVGAAGWLVLPRRLMFVYSLLPLCLKVTWQGGRGGRVALLWYADRMLRSGAFLAALLGRPGAAGRVAAGVCKALLRRVAS